MELCNLQGEFRNRPGVAQRFPGGLGSQISWHSARESGEIVSFTHRPPLPPGIFIRGWVDPRSMVRSEGNMSLKNPVTPPGIDPGTVRLVAQRLNHYATPDPLTYRDFTKICDVKLLSSHRLLVHQEIFQNCISDTPCLRKTQRQICTFYITSFPPSAPESPNYTDNSVWFNFRDDVRRAEINKYSVAISKHRSVMRALKSFRVLKAYRSYQGAPTSIGLASSYTAQL
jgi:hypothetical protein